MNEQTPQPPPPTRREVIPLMLLAAGAGYWAWRGTRPAAAPDNPYALSDAAARRTDPARIGYRETARVPCPLSRPRLLVSAPDGSWWVGGDRRALRVSESGQTLAEISLSATPTALAADAESLWVGLHDHVEVFSTHGTPKAAWPSFGGGAWLSGLALLGDHVWVAESQTRKVHVFTRDGQSVRSLPEANAPEDSRFVIYLSPLRVAASGGRVWVTNPGRLRVEAYSADGAREQLVGHSGAGLDGFCGCCNPTALALLPDGRIVTAEKRLPRVKVLRPDGSLDCVVAGVESFAPGSDGLDVAVDSRGRVLVLDPIAASVRVYERTPSHG